MAVVLHQATSGTAGAMEFAAARTTGDAVPHLNSATAAPVRAMVSHKRMQEHTTSYLMKLAVDVGNQVENACGKQPQLSIDAISAFNGSAPIFPIHGTVGLSVATGELDTGWEFVPSCCTQHSEVGCRGLLQNLTMSARGSARRGGADDKHVFHMSKKIAQLTRVIYHLNTRNDDHAADMAAAKVRKLCSANRRPARHLLILLAP